MQVGRALRNHRGFAVLTRTVALVMARRRLGCPVMVVGVAISTVISAAMGRHCFVAREVSWPGIGAGAASACAEDVAQQHRERC